MAQNKFDFLKKTFKESISDYDLMADINSVYCVFITGPIVDDILNDSFSIDNLDTTQMINFCLFGGEIEKQRFLENVIQKLCLAQTKMKDRILFSFDDVFSIFTVQVEQKLLFRFIDTKFIVPSEIYKFENSYIHGKFINQNEMKTVKYFQPHKIIVTEKKDDYNLMTNFILAVDKSTFSLTSESTDAKIYFASNYNSLNKNHTENFLRLKNVYIHKNNLWNVDYLESTRPKEQIYNHEANCNCFCCDNFKCSIPSTFFSNTGNRSNFSSCSSFPVTNISNVSAFDPNKNVNSGYNPTTVYFTPEEIKQQPTGVITRLSRDEESEDEEHDYYCCDYCCPSSDDTDCEDEKEEIKDTNAIKIKEIEDLLERIKKLKELHSNLIKNN